MKQQFTAWGQIYTGISAKDYMDGTSNFYGVHSVTLYVDSVKVFNSTTDEVSADENRMINGFTDYDELMRTRRLIMRSYKLPGNRLRLIETGSDRGLVTIDEERDYHSATYWRIISVISVNIVLRCEAKTGDSSLCTRSQ